jgi:pimeloyl-ACP methyl ester carboxylesterase
VEPMMQIVRLPDVGHWTLMEKPDLASAAIRDFIDELDPKK